MQDFSHAHNKSLKCLCIIILKPLKHLLSMKHRVYPLAFEEFTLHFEHLFTHRLTAHLKNDPEILTLI